MGIDEVSNFYSRYKEEEYREGTLLFSMNAEGEIVDYNHHVIPKLHLPDTIKTHGKDEKPQLEYDPKLFDDEVFESWYKTNQMFLQTIQNHQQLWPLALQSLQDNWETFASKKNWKCPPGSQRILFELRVQLFSISATDSTPPSPSNSPAQSPPLPENEKGSPSSSLAKNRAFCMCTVLEDYFPIMQSTPQQIKALLDIMNAIQLANSSSARPKSLNFYRVFKPFSIICTCI